MTSNKLPLILSGLDRKQQNKYNPHSQQTSSYETKLMGEHGFDKFLSYVVNSITDHVILGSYGAIFAITSNDSGRWSKKFALNETLWKPIKLYFTIGSWSILYFRLVFHSSFKGFNCVQITRTAKSSLISRFSCRHWPAAYHAVNRQHQMHKCVRKETTASITSITSLLIRLLLLTVFLYYRYSIHWGFPMIY